MKKSFLILAGAAIMAVGFSSCKKNWTCTCSNGVPSTTISNQTKSQATTSCDTYAAFTGASCNI